MSADTQPRVGARNDPLDAGVSRSSGLGETQAVRSDERVVCARSGSAHLAAVLRELPKTRPLLTTNLTAVTTEQHDIACDDNSSGV
jgi:hypothetical protein